jgi:hypothetical protein
MAAKLLIAHIATAISTLERRRPMMAIMPQKTKTVAVTTGVEAI